MTNIGRTSVNATATHIGGSTNNSNMLSSGRRYNAPKRIESMCCKVENTGQLLNLDDNTSKHLESVSRMEKNNRLYSGPLLKLLLMSSWQANALPIASGLFKED